MAAIARRSFASLGMNSGILNYPLGWMLSAVILFIIWLINIVFHSHPVLIEPPEGITFAVDGNTKLSVSGIDKQKVGQIAAIIRKLRKDDPYKNKGICYEGEQICRKVGKTGK